MNMKKKNYVDLDANMYHFDNWITIIDPDKLKSTFKILLETADFRIVNFTEYHFPVQGYTCIWLLAESHLALHTFPSKGKSYLQISSCNKEKLDNFIYSLNL